jgi:ABC-type Fe3+ transport system permease subunit
MRTAVTLILLIVGMFSFGAGCSQQLIASRGFAVHAESDEEQSFAGSEAREEAAQWAKIYCVIFVISFPVGFIMMMTTPTPESPSSSQSSAPRRRPPDDDYPF